MTNLLVLAKQIGWTPAKLERERRKYRMKHAEEGDAMLARWMERTHREVRDQVRLPARQNGLLHPPQYVGDMAGAIDDPGESVPEHYQNQLVMQARTRRAEEEERSQEQQRAQLRSVNETLREKIRRGEDIAPHLAALQRDLRSDHAA